MKIETVPESRTCDMCAYYRMDDGHPWCIKTGVWIRPHGRDNAYCCIYFRE